MGERKQRKGVVPGGEVDYRQFCLHYVFKMRERTVCLYASGNESRERRNLIREKVEKNLL